MGKNEMKEALEATNAMNERVKNILEQAEISVNEIEGVQMTVTARLANGYALSAMATPIEIKEYPGMSPKDIAMIKIEERLFELETYLLLEMGYQGEFDEDNDGWIEDKCDMCIPCDMECQRDFDDYSDGAYYYIVDMDYDPDLEKCDGLCDVCEYWNDYYNCLI